MWRNQGDSPDSPSLPPFGIDGLSLPPISGRLVKWAAIIVSLLVAVLVISILRGVYTNWLWFQSLSYNNVYITILLTKVWLFLAGASVLALVMGSNLLLALRFSRGTPQITTSLDATSLVRRLTFIIVGLVILISSVIFGIMASGQWEVVLRYLHTSPFGVADPQFQKDVAFYVFTLPVLTFLQGWVLGALIVCLLATVGTYFARFTLRGTPFTFTPKIVTHLTILGALLLLDIAFSYYLNIFELVYSDDGAVFGAAFTDVTAKIPALRALIVLSVISGVLLVTARFFTRSMMLMVAPIGLWFASSIIVGSVYPNIVQRFQVVPNELTRETPYLARNIEFTRKAFGLDNIKTHPFPVETYLDAKTVANNQATIDNIRLWDNRPLKDSYNQIQFFRPYYEFLDVDVDRYNVDGQVRQVMVATRELSPQRLDPNAQTWINQSLKYTHGMGVVISPVEKFTDEGRPEFFLSNVPPDPSPTMKSELTLSRPEIYYGEGTVDYVIVNTNEQEFDYEPLEGAPVYTHYAGDGGIRMSSFLQRLAYAWEFADANILISGELTPESRIQYRRTISDRVSTIAPFLQLDNDPYTVVAQGQVWWIQDAYTTTPLYPYSDPMDYGFNYVRNSVKAVMNAYSGDVVFYIFDNNDPLIETYAKIFPKLFQSRDSLPSYLESHIRYPEDLFTWQAQAYLLYHMEDPVLFYNKADQWSLPNELFFDDAIPLLPYYITMKLPGELEEEFVLVQPFTPFDRKNMVAWLAARSDGENYGKLQAYTFPRSRQVDGPEQIEARIDVDSKIAEQFGLWRRAGTRVLRGNLLVIPIENTLLYVEPVYLQAQNLDFPELKMVIMADAANTVTMQPTLNAALQDLIGENVSSVGTSIASAQSTSEPSSISTLTQLRTAIEQIQAAANEMLGQFGKIQDSLEELEQDLRETST